MNLSLQSIIDDALYTEQVEDTYPVYDEASFLDEDTVKLAHALDFLSGNLDNIGTTEEKIAELHMLHEKLANPVPFDITGGRVISGAETVGGKHSGGAVKSGGNISMSTDAYSKAQQQATASGQKAGVQKGLNQAGIGQAIKNTWRSGAGGKAALIGGGLLGAGLAGKALFGGQSKTSSYVGEWLVPEYDEYDVYLNKTAAYDIEVIHEGWEELCRLGSTDAHITTKVASLHNMDAFEYFLEKIASSFSSNPFAALASVDTSKLPTKQEAMLKQNPQYAPQQGVNTKARQEAVDRMAERRERQQAGSRKARRQAEIKARGAAPQGGASPSGVTPKTKQTRVSGDRLVAQRQQMYGGEGPTLQQRKNDPAVQRKLQARREAKAQAQRVVAQQSQEAKYTQKAQEFAGQKGGKTQAVVEQNLRGDTPKANKGLKETTQLRSGEHMKVRDQVAQAERHLAKETGRAQAIEQRNIQKGTNLDATKPRKGQARVDAAQANLDRVQQQAAKSETKAVQNIVSNPVENTGNVKTKSTSVSTPAPSASKSTKALKAPGGGKGTSGLGGRHLVYGGAALSALAGLEYLRRRRNKNKRRAA